MCTSAAAVLCELAGFRATPSALISDETSPVYTSIACKAAAAHAQCTMPQPTDSHPPPCVRPSSAGLPPPPQSTFSTHPWRVRAASGKLLGDWMSSEAGVLEVHGPEDLRFRCILEDTHWQKPEWGKWRQRGTALGIIPIMVRSPRAVQPATHARRITPLPQNPLCCVRACAPSACLPHSQQAGMRLAHVASWRQAACLACAVRALIAKLPCPRPPLHAHAGLRLCQ